MIDSISRRFSALLLTAVLTVSILSFFSCENRPGTDPADTPNDSNTTTYITDEHPVVNEEKIVFANTEGSGTKDGSSAENAAAFQNALGLIKATGGTLIVCGSVTLTDYLFPSNGSNIHVTSVYNGVDHRETGAELILCGMNALYGDYSFDGLKIVNGADYSYLCLQYNNVTIGEDVKCVKGKGVAKDIALVCGYYADSAGHRSTNTVSCYEDTEIIVKAGNWRYINGGNLRNSSSAVVGTVSKDATIVINVEGGKYTEYAGSEYNSAIGMNSVEGTVYMEISGGTFTGPVSVIPNAGGFSRGIRASVTGNITLKITGGTFSAAECSILQSKSNAPVLEKSSNVTLCIEKATFRTSKLTVESTYSQNERLIIAEAYRNKINIKNFKSIEIGEDACKKIYAPTPAGTVIATYTEPPFPAVAPKTGELTATEEAKLSTEMKNSLKNVKTLASSNGTDLYQHQRILNDKNNEYNFNAVESVKFVSMLTGEYSINKTATNYNIAKIGGGYIVDCGSFSLLAFGDTKADGDTGLPWRANALAFTTDTDYTDGLTIDGFYANDCGDYAGMATEFLLSDRNPGTEASKIPTGGIMIGDKIYFGFMSVVSWDTGDPVWPCNYGGLAISSDMGRSWETPSDLRWPNESGYVQLYPVVDGDYVYFFGVPGGRRGSCKLMRVPTAEIENFDAYEYLVGRTEDGKPIYEKGYDAMMSDYAVAGPGVGGVGVMYNEYLGEWMMMYCTRSSGRIMAASIVMQVAKTIDGVWSDPVMVMSHKSYGSVYEPRINNNFVSEGGKKIMVICSRADIYNSIVFEMEISKK